MPSKASRSKKTVKRPKTPKTKAKAKKGSGKGWHDDPVRHKLARYGIATTLPDGRRLDVSKFIPARGVYRERSERESKDFAFEKAMVLQGALNSFDRGDIDLGELQHHLNQFERATVNRGLDYTVENGANMLYEHLVTESYGGVDENYVERGIARINHFIQRYTRPHPDEDAIEVYRREIVKLKKR